MTPMAIKRIPAPVFWESYVIPSSSFIPVAALPASFDVAAVNPAIMQTREACQYFRGQLHRKGSLGDSVGVGVSTMFPPLTRRHVPGSNSSCISLSVVLFMAGQDLPSSSSLSKSGDRPTDCSPVVGLCALDYSNRTEQRRIMEEKRKGHYLEAAKAYLPIIIDDSSESWL